ncbi:hypothetical protein ABKN59_009207 [Abortiporus biennis]
MSHLALLSYSSDGPIFLDEELGARYSDPGLVLKFRGLPYLVTAITCDQFRWSAVCFDYALYRAVISSSHTRRSSIRSWRDVVLVAYSRYGDDRALDLCWQRLLAEVQAWVLPHTTVIHACSDT